MPVMNPLTPIVFSPLAGVTLKPVPEPVEQVPVLIPAGGCRPIEVAIDAQRQPEWT
jgi:hypothetical protein